MKINFACGRQTWPEFFCIDAAHHPKATRAPDLIHALQFYQTGALMNPVPLADGCADELHSYHFLEHVARYQADAVLAEFRRLLKPGGKLVLELPNLEAAARNLLAGMDDQMSLWPIYGDWNHKDPYMLHKHGYTPRSIVALLTDAGFRKIELKPPQTHGARANRDMRVEAVK